MKKWNRSAMRFSKCHYVPEQGTLAVSFRNHDAFQVPVEALLGTSAAVAKAAGVDRVTISRIENGRLCSTYETLSRILAAMGKTVQHLAVEDVRAVHSH